MKLSKLPTYLLYFGAAFCIGGCEIFEINPFGVGFVAACGMVNEGMVFAYIGVVLGDLLTLTPMVVVRYSLMMLGLVAMLELRSVQLMKGKRMVLSLVVGGYVSLVNVLCHYLLPGYVSIIRGVLEGVVCFSVTYIYACGLRTLKTDPLGFLQDSQLMLGVLALAASVIFGAPEYLLDRFVFAKILCFLSMLCFLYKFGMSIGMAWGAVCGAILSLRLGENHLLSEWILLLLVCGVIANLFHMGRHTFAALFFGVYLLLGYFTAADFFSEESLKAAVTALFLFVFMPGSWLLPIDGNVTERLGENQQEWGKLVMERMRNLAAAFKRMDYTFSSDGNVGIGFKQVGNMLESFTDELDCQVPLKKTVETNILEDLGGLGIQVKALSLIKSKQGQYQMFLSARVRRGRLVGAESVRKIISKNLAIPMELTRESRQLVGRNFDLICMRQKPEYRVITAARRLAVCEEMVSGDNFYIGDIPGGRKLIMVADGMGNGSMAAADSSVLIESLEELLSAGFDQRLSVQVVNTYLAEKNRGEHFSTLDMLLIDTYTGYGQLLKYGAATTYIKRKKWIECVKSTSLPVGVCQDASFESCGKKFYHEDLIVMLSDGVLESIIYENKDDYMRELLTEIEDDEPETVVQAIVQEIRRVSGRRLKDDATVVVCKLFRTC